MPDDLAHTGGTIVSPRFLREHIFPWHKRIGDRVRAKRLPYLYHSDGRLYDVIDDLLACGYNALHPCEPASMDIVKLKREYGGRLCLIGNINADIVATNDPQAIEQEVASKIPAAAAGGGYIYNIDHSVPPTVSLASYRHLLDCVRRYAV